MKRQQIIAILKGQKDLLKRYSVRNIYLFGSSSRNETTEASDIDLIVEFKPDPEKEAGLKRYFPTQENSHSRQLPETL